MILARTLVRVPLPFLSTVSSITALGLILILGTGSMTQTVASDPTGGLIVSPVAVAALLSLVAVPLLAVPSLLAN